MLSSHDLQKSRKTLPNSAIGCEPITLGTELPRPTRWVYVGGAGNVILTFADGSKATFTAVPVGLYKWAISLAETTGGPASTLVALY